jgi:hypothetical protein
MKARVAKSEGPTAKSAGRNPKSERRPRSEVRNPQAEMIAAKERKEHKEFLVHFGPRVPGVRLGQSFQISDFGFRISDFGPGVQFRPTGKSRLLILALLIPAAIFLAGCNKSGPPAATEKAAPEEEGGAHVARDAKGRVVINLSDEAQGDMGILVKKPEAGQLSPELKGYGRVQDPAPLVGLINELASARAAAVASSNEQARLKTLAAQDNASARALQAAEAAALRDQLAVQSAQDRLELSWGTVARDESELWALTRSLTALETVLIRVDVPLGENLASPPSDARVATLAGEPVSARFLGRAPSVDPQMQGRGFLLLLKPNTAKLAPGEAVTGYLKIPGEPLAGVVVPREAVVRTEGAGWIYLHGGGGEAFTRVQVALEYPTPAGWFVTNGVSANDYIVVTGAQQLLSLEQKGQGGE